MPEDMFSHRSEKENRGSQVKSAQRSKGRQRGKRKTGVSGCVGMKANIDTNLDDTDRAKLRRTRPTQLASRNLRMGDELSAT